MRRIGFISVLGLWGGVFGVGGLSDVGRAVAGDWSVVSADPGVTPYQYVSEDFLVRNPPWTTNGVQAEYLAQYGRTIAQRENGVLAAVLDGSAAQSTTLLGDQWADTQNLPNTPWLVTYDVHFVAADPNDIPNLHVSLQFQASGITRLTLTLTGQATPNHIEFRNSPTHTWFEVPEFSSDWRVRATLSRSAPGSIAMVWLDNIHVTEAASTYYDETFSLVRGDLNCDGLVNFDDINPFVLALSDPAGYAAANPGCDILNGDMNADGATNFDDINGFVAALTGG